jgi:hypothetical protein
MPAFVVWIAGAMQTILGYLIARVMFMIGIQAVTVVGLGAFLLDLKNAAILAYGQMPAAMLQWLGLLRVDQAALVVFAAISARLTLGFAQNSVTRLVSMGPQAGQL